MAGHHRATWGLVVGLGLGLGSGAACGGATHDRSSFSGTPGAAGAAGNGLAASPVSTGGAAGGAATGVGGAPSMTSPPSTTFQNPGANFAPGSVCEAGGWCWYDPRPTGDWWTAVAGAGSADVWIGGMSNELLHFAPGGWTAVTSPLSDTEGIWASAANDVWLGGIGQPGTAAIAHWDGRAVTLSVSLGSGEINDVWGSGPDDVYAVGFGTAQHWNGQSWSTVPGVVGMVVSGSGPNDVWVGSDTGMEHFDGTSWTAVPQFAGVFMLGVAAVSPNDVWAIAAQQGVQSIEHFDGAAWTTSLQIPSTPVSLHNIAVGAGGSSDVWLSGDIFVGTVDQGYLQHFDGATWTMLAPNPSNPVYRATGTRGFGDLAVGQGGEILTLSSQPAPAFAVAESGPSQTLTGVWGSSPTDMWAVGGAGTALHYDGTIVSSVATGVAADLMDVWGTGADDVWIVGREGTAFHFDGQALSPVATGTTADLYAVFSAAPGDVWIGGDSTLTHLQGGAFQSVAVSGLPTPFSIDDFHGLGTTDVWLAGGQSAVFGSDGFVAHFDGTAWSAADMITASEGGDTVSRVWELAPDDVWAMSHPIARSIVGFWHFDGTTWTDATAVPSAATFMFPDPAVTLDSFIFGAHDRWIVGPLGLWQRNTQ